MKDVDFVMEDGEPALLTCPFLLRKPRYNYMS